MEPVSSDQPPYSAYTKTWSGVRLWCGVTYWSDFLEWDFGVNLVEPGSRVRNSCILEIPSTAQPQLCLVDSAVSTIWVGPFPTEGVSG